MERGLIGASPPGPGTAVEGQMYVGFQLLAQKRHPYPLVLVHGGGGQATDWMGTPDGRDGWMDYFLAAGYDVYYVDRPGHGRSPNARAYGELGIPATTDFIANMFSLQSKQYPGGGAKATKEVIQHTASSEPGPTVSERRAQGQSRRTARQDRSGHCRRSFEWRALRLAIDGSAPGSGERRARHRAGHGNYRQRLLR